MSVVDVLIHVNAELSPKDRSKVEQEARSCVGVVSASFDKHPHSHALMVQYKPDIVQSSQVLEAVRRQDPSATMVGL